MQLDQTGYEYKNDPTIWLNTDHVDNNLNAYIATLIMQYVNAKQSLNYTSCGGVCSDNASWYAQGIPVVFPFEAKMAFGYGYLYEHSMDDTIEKLSLTHMMDFTKLAIAFVTEMAEPTVGSSVI